MTSSSLHKTKPDDFEEVFAPSPLVLGETNNLAFGDEEAKNKSIVTIIIIVRTRVIKSRIFFMLALGDFQLEIISECFMCCGSYSSANDRWFEMRTPILNASCTRRARVSTAKRYHYYCYYWGLSYYVCEKVISFL
jgi:hypothetical protein